MSDASGGPGWWLASDGRWYPPEQAATPAPAATDGSAPVITPASTEARRTLLPTGAPPPEPVWDGTAWTTTDAAGTSYRWDGAAWQPAPAAPLAPVDPHAAPVPVQPVVATGSPGPDAVRGGSKTTLVLVGVVAVLVLIAGGLAVVKLRGGTSEFNTGVPAAGPDVDPRDDVSLADDVVVVRGGAGSVKGVATDHTSYTLDAGAPGVADLAPGKVMLIAGLDAGRVQSVDRSTGDAVVTLEPVAITDVVKDGSFSWDDPGPADGQALAFVGAPIPSDPETEGDSGDGASSGDGTTESSVRPSSFRRGGQAGNDTDPFGGPAGSDPADGPFLPIGFHPDGPDVALPPGVTRAGGAAPGESAADPTTTTLPKPERSLSMRVSGWEVGFAASKAGSGLDLELSAKKGVKSNNPPPAEPNTRPPSGFDSDTGALELGVTVKMHLNEAKHSGNFTVSGGSITDMSAHAPMSGWAEGYASAKSEQAQQYPKSLIIRVPIAYEWPVFIYGIPFYVYVQTNFLLQPSISTRSTGLDVPVRVEFNGDAGVRFANGTASNEGTTVTGSVKDPPLTTVNATPTIGAMAMVFAVQAPRIGFGIGTTAYAAGARAGVFFDFVTSLGITIGPSTAIVACRSVSLTLTAGVGGEIKVKFWGTDNEATVATKHTLWKDQKDWYEPEVPACKL